MNSMPNSHPDVLLSTEELREENARLRADLSDAAMSVRRLLRKLHKYAPGDPIIEQLGDWLLRKGLQGSILREGKHQPISGSLSDVVSDSLKGPTDGK